MKKIKGIETDGNYLYDDNGQLKIQRVIANEDFLDVLGEAAAGDKLISLNKACEWLKNTLPPAMMRSDLYMFNGGFIEDFKKAMEGGEE